MKLVKNAAGRFVPTEINGETQIPFKGVDKYKPTGVKSKPPIRSCIDYPANGNKVIKDLKTILPSSNHKLLKGFKLPWAINCLFASTMPLKLNALFLSCFWSDFDASLVDKILSTWISVKNEIEKISHLLPNLELVVQIIDDSKDICLIAITTPLFDPFMGLYSVAMDWDSFDRAHSELVLTL